MPAVEKPLRLNSMMFNLDRPTVQFLAGDGDTLVDLTLDALEQSIHNMMLARHMMRVHKDHDGCPDCTMNAIEKVGQ